MTANGSVLPGGDKQVILALQAQGYKVYGAGEIGMMSQLLEFETSFHEADIHVDAILSFRWLAAYNLDVKCKDYGLQSNGDQKYFIPGVQELVPQGVKLVRHIAIEHRNFQIRKHPGEATNHPHDMVDGEYFQTCENLVHPSLEDYQFLHQLIKEDPTLDCD